MIKIGIIGGSGLDNPNILQNATKKEVDTEYGKPSSLLTCGKIEGVDVVLLARHGSEHTIPPTQVNYRANIMALKEEGCTHIIATTAVGSLREKIHPGDLVILDQFIDFTRHRAISFFEKFESHQPVHTPMAVPFSKSLRNLLNKKCQELNLIHHQSGTVVTIEGPRFSTKAESSMFRAWGADVINMSIAPEVILANELQIPYSAIAMSTDYDCWKEDEESVTWEAILEIFKKNANNVIQLLLKTIPEIKEERADTQIIDSLKGKIRTIPNWPKSGIMFRDVTTLFKDKQGMKELIDILAQRYMNYDLDAVVGIESRGFIIGAALAYSLGLGFIPIRKSGKLPADTITEEYELEYGTDKMEIHRDAFNPGDKVIIIDDLIATGGTALAACNLVKKLGGEISECCFAVDLPELGGSRRIEQAGHKIFKLISFNGE